MATTAQSIITRAQTILQEAGAGVRWPVAELLDWVNAGVQEICQLRKSANTRVVNHQLAAGSRQTLPTDGVDLVDVIRNMGAGSAPGDVIRKVPKEVLDALLPTWHAAGATAAIKHYVYDPVTPKVWYCFPPSTGVNFVELKYAAVPAALTAAGQNIALDDIYANALLDYVLFRAFNKDSETPANATMAAAHRQMFENSLGLKAQADAGAVKKPVEG